MCSTGPQDRPAALEEEGETYLHPLVADRSEVPRPSLEHRGGGMLGSPEGSHSDPPVCLDPHSAQAWSARETGLADHWPESQRAAPM